MGIGGSFPRGKAARREAVYSSVSSAKVKNGGAIPPLPHPDFSLHLVHTGSGAHPDFYTMGTGGKAAGA
jgi:hypothetical protein